MYRSNPTLDSIIKQVASEFKDQFGFDLSEELILYIYGSQTLGVLHYMRNLQPSKMRGLLIFVPLEKRIKEYNVEKPNPEVDLNNNKIMLKPLPQRFSKLLVIK